MKRKTYRSLFWPIVLMGVGVVWLLGSMGIIPNANFASFLSLWPIILIVIGIDILVGGRTAYSGAIVGVIAVALVAFALIAGPSLGLATGGTLKTENLSVDIGESLTADIDLNLSTQPVNISALGDKTSLIKGEIDYYGTLHFSDTGTTNRKISLNQSDIRSWNIVWDPNARWEIGLTPNLPLDLTIDGSSGSVELNLRELRLTDLVFDQGSGSAALKLPASTQPYTARLTGGSGSLQVTLPGGADITLRLDRGSGSTTIYITEGNAVRLDIRDAGTGSVNLPDWLEEVRVSDDGKEGKWETEGFEQAEHKITIICNDLGSGSFTIK